MIFLFISNELSVDKFHKQGQNIYRVMRGYDAEKSRTPYLSGPYAPALLNDFPEDVKKAVRVMPENGLVSIGDNSFNEKRVYIADADFFNLFSFELIKGNAATVLKDPASVVLTETTARKYFGNQDPIGKTIELNKEVQFNVTGVARDLPPNSHLQFDLVIPISNFNNAPWFHNWINNSMFVYVLLDEKTKKEKVEKSFPQFMQKYMGKNMAKSGMKFDLKLTPLSDIYFEAGSSYDNVKHGDKAVVYIFLSIAVLILLIACINFMNLSTIRAVERSKEVGIRKVMGAMKNNLLVQFIGESLLLTLISCLLSIGLLQILMPFYNALLGYSLNVSWSTATIYWFLGALIIVVGVFAGSYPAFFLSAFSPIQALKGKLKLGKAGGVFRQALVVVQFSISVFLIVGTIIIMNQMNYMKGKELGYDKEHTVLVRMDNGEISQGRKAFKNHLQNKPAIKSVSLMSGEPGGFFDQHNFEAEGQPDVWKARTAFADFEYVKTLGLKIIAGRDFSAQLATDTTDAVLINRTAASKLGFSPEQAIGKWIMNKFRDSTRRRIVGVVEDFNFLSLKENMDALVIAPHEDRRVAAIKLQSGDIASAIASIKQEYNRVAPGYPFEYSFLDQKFDELYKADIREQKIMSIFSALAIFIACLGLFGLASFTATKRLKEIGVRKVLGSSSANIVLLLSKDLLKPVFLATLIAIPISYYSMNHWLQNFAYQTALSWWIFALAAVITFLIAFLTVSVKAINAALSNPIQNLRTE